jgi:hypothetical protein
LKRTLRETRNEMGEAKTMSEESDNLFLLFLIKIDKIIFPFVLNYLILLNLQD